MIEILQALTGLAGLTFVVSSMLGMGVSLTIKQIIEPLRNISLVVKILITNFILVPIVGYLIIFLIQLDEPLAIGLILLSTAAGAPFLPKLVQVAKGNIAFCVGLMTLLMVVTVIYVPIVLPILIPGVQVNPIDIARSLIILMMIPLAIGLLIKARYTSIADSLRPIMNQTSSFSLIALIVLAIPLNFNEIISLIGTGGILAIIILVLVTFALGYLLGGPNKDYKRVTSLGTAQRNIAAALVIAISNFQDPNILAMIIVGSLLIPIILMILAGELGRR
ncbi:bile acid:sodium symporter family protein [[Eubacterium] cellulosolvens]